MPLTVVPKQMDIQHVAVTVLQCACLSLSPAGFSVPVAFDPSLIGSFIQLTYSSFSLSTCWRLDFLSCSHTLLSPLPQSIVYYDPFYRWKDSWRDEELLSTVVQ